MKVLVANDLYGRSSAAGVAVPAVETSPPTGVWSTSTSAAGSGSSGRASPAAVPAVLAPPGAMLISAPEAVPGAHLEQLVPDLVLLGAKVRIEWLVAAERPKYPGGKYKSRFNINSTPATTSEG